MNYTPKKENIIKLNNWMYKTSVGKELQEFYKKNIYERYANAEEEEKEKLYSELYSNRTVFWFAKSNIEADTIAKNPTKENAENRMNELRKLGDCTPVIFEAMVNYLKDDFEHIKNLGHTEAYSYLCNVLDESNKLINPAPCFGFQYRGDINHFYNQCIEYKVISSTTSLDSFKIAFEGCDYRGEEPLKWTTKQKNHIVYLFDLLLKKKLIHTHIQLDGVYIEINFNESIGVLMGKTNIQVGKIRASWKQYERTTPSNADYIENLVDSLNKE